MAPGFRVRVNGTLLLTVEALYQACRYPHIPDLQDFIISQKSPMTLKMRIRQFREDSRPDWDRVRVRIMKWCIRVKLSQNLMRFGNLLLETGDKPIVEDSRKDPFWGAIRSSSGHLVGANVLGRLLMELREELRTVGMDQPFSVLPPDVPELLLLGKPIEGVRSDMTQHAVENQGAILWLPHNDARFKLASNRVTQDWTRTLTQLMERIAKSGSTFEAKVELVSRGGCSTAILREIEDVLKELEIQSRHTVTGGFSFDTTSHLRREPPSKGNTVISESSNNDLVKSTSSSSKGRS